jgi:hypothetical protein
MNEFSVRNKLKMKLKRHLRHTFRSDYHLSFTTLGERYSIEEDVLGSLRSLKSSSNFLPQAVRHLRHIVQQKSKFYTLYFCDRFFPRMNAWINGTEIDIQESEFWFLQTARHWMPRLPIDRFEITRVGLNRWKEICSLTVLLPLHIIAPQLYVIPTRRYLQIKWNTRGDVLGATILSTRPLSPSPSPPPSKKLDLQWVLHNSSQTFAWEGGTGSSNPSNPSNPNSDPTSDILRDESMGEEKDPLESPAPPPLNTAENLAQ